jgi:hypothetical protein
MAECLPSEAIDKDSDQEELSLYHKDRLYIVKSGLKQAFDTLPERPRVATDNVYSIAEIQALFTEYFNAHRHELQIRGNDHIYNFSNDPIGQSLDCKVYCRHQLNKILKLLLVHPPL